MNLLKTGCVLVSLWAGAARAQDVTPQEPLLEEGFRLELGLQLGYAFGSDPKDGDNSGPGARLQLLARFNRYIALGPELAIYSGAGYAPTVRPNPGPEGGERTTYSAGGLAQLLGVLRLGVDLGAVRPALLVGSGVFSGKQDGEYFDTYYCVGGELAFPLGRLPLVLDARYYRPLMDSESAHPNYITLGLGTRLSW